MDRDAEGNLYPRKLDTPFMKHAVFQARPAGRPRARDEGWGGGAGEKGVVLLLRVMWKDRAGVHQSCSPRRCPSSEQRR